MFIDTIFLILESMFFPQINLLISKVMSKLGHQANLSIQNKDVQRNNRRKFSTSSGILFRLSIAAIVHSSLDWGRLIVFWTAQNKKMSHVFDTIQIKRVCWPFQPSDISSSAVWSLLARYGLALSTNHTVLWHCQVFFELSRLL